MKAQLNAPAMLVLGLVLVASGCTNTEGSDSADVSVEQESGVTIQSFETQRSEVREGDSIRPRMVVKNNGGRAAQNAKALLYNYPSVWSSEDGTNAVLDFGDIRAPDPDRNRPSPPARDDATIQVNSDYRQGQNVPVDVKAVLVYDYDTIADTGVIVAPRALAPEVDSSPEVDNTAGPVQMDVVSEAVISVPEDETQASTQVCLEVKNAGDGTPLLPSVYDSGIRSVPLSNINENVNAMRVTAEIRSDIVDVAGENPKTIRLFDSTATTRCWDLQANVDQNINRQTTERVSFIAEYAYRDKDSIGLSITGRDGTPDASSSGGSGSGASIPSPPSGDSDVVEPNVDTPE
nr:MAG: hypothetical protein J07AB56_06900 [Candidatus Nanosalinarum sp. J07AB56]